jgi:hypothetical protein
MQAGAKTPRSEGRVFEGSLRNGLRYRSSCSAILFDYFYSLERVRSLSMSSSPSKFHALVENDRGYVKVSLEYLGGIKKLRLSLERLTDDRHFPQRSGSFSWRVERSGTRQDLAQFIEIWVPKCPDPDLLNQGLARLNEQVPESIL